MNFLTQLFQVLFTPIGLAGVGVGLILVFIARRSARMAWLLVSLGRFAASLAKFRNEFVLEPPALVFPLQQLREMGRPLTIALLGLLLILAWQRTTKGRGRSMPTPILFLIGVQLAIFLKTVLFGSPSFATLAAATFGAVVVMINWGPSRWIMDEEGFYLAAWSMALVGLIFLAVNLYQAVFDLYAITFVKGRLVGTTGNPQHAATLLAAILPAFIFLIEQPAHHLRSRLLWLSGLALVLGALYMTGSRTGVLMAITTVLFFYRQRVGLLLRIGLMAGLALGVVIIVFNQNALLVDLSLTNINDKLLSGTNSRDGIWAILWRNFQAYPLFGAPLRGDRLMGYGESSWLGTAAAVGLVGLIPLLLFGLTALQMMGRLVGIGQKSRMLFLQSSMVISGLASLLFGSVFEAYLLGNLTFPIMALLLYLALGHYVITLG
ncbi:MAG: O-antigen ligase family protein [Anaerolineae bacterium]|nr:O-antigen ligase family protein [Anaerolineae bacterium]